MMIQTSPPGRTLRRASKSRPCPVCGRGDWCSAFADGRACICMRTPSARPTANGGHLHFLDGKDAKGPRPYARFVAACKAMKAEPKRDPAELERLHRLHAAAVSTAPLNELAKRLGVTPDALRNVGIGWSGRAWSFPMFNAEGRVVGLRYRHAESADKWSEKGGSEGIFTPPVSVDATPAALLIVEGPSDLAALLDMLAESPALARCVAVGRPSCTGGVAILRRLARRLRPAKVAVVADADEPGRRGADALARLLAGDGLPVRVVVPPGKDVRQWRQSGATGADLLNLLRTPGVPAGKGVTQ